MILGPEDSGSIREATERTANESQEKMNNELRQEVDVVVSDDLGTVEDVHHHLRRGLKSRQDAMIAIGGAIGTGLIIGTGSALKPAGPGSLFIGYSFVGILCYLVMTAIGPLHSPATELLSAGYVQRLPRILTVQSAACAPIYQAWLWNDPDISAVEPHPTCAEGVALPNPPRGTQVLQAIKRYNGTMLAVDDAEVMSCWRDMAQMGIFMEPTSAVAVAGAWLARNNGDLILPQENVVVLVTGHGLRNQTDIDAAPLRPTLPLVAQQGTDCAELMTLGSSRRFASRVYGNCRKATWLDVGFASANVHTNT
ncbi:hypothetical protein PV11_09959 [Exophiala sideris]|uniref:Tryptophan synthase beta chain-like PALP domain-containing protein n=1 Tax=Exophiala sideris TaxID=1016849 RepID=A0A0D1WSZ2_9EURO|nr:hypothetical protein PV11_09959 [Exophiala sideris]